jgi:hypothetical protein
MRPIGFSTGALALGDFRRALTALAGVRVNAVELSALRENELLPLIEAMPGLDLARFEYISIHAPSRRERLTDSRLVAALQPALERGIPVVVHPDIMEDFAPWRALGRLLVIENMDKRKPIGRTVEELDAVFSEVPEAGLCFDIGHARQVDRTMTEADAILRRFAGRLVQLHVSQVNARNAHEPLTLASIAAFQEVADLIPPHVPAIIESPVDGASLENEMRNIRESLRRDARSLAAAV